MHFVNSVRWHCTIFMSTLTGLSGEYVTFDQNRAKKHGNFETFLRPKTGKVDSFGRLTVLILQFGKDQFEGKK